MPPDCVGAWSPYACLAGHCSPLVRVSVLCRRTRTSVGNRTRGAAPVEHDIRETRAIPWDTPPHFVGQIGSAIATDGGEIVKDYRHECVNHTQKEYARGDVHEQRAECLLSLLKPS
jgi:hypothetical protein